MKPVTGTVGSSKPVSVSKAAAMFSRFAWSEKEALRDVAAFLRLTSHSFDELVKFYEGPRSGNEGGHEAEKRKRRRKQAAFSVGQDGNSAEIEGNPGRSTRFQCVEAVGIPGIKEGQSGRGRKKKAAKEGEGR